MFAHASNKLLSFWILKIFEERTKALIRPTISMRECSEMGAKNGKPASALLVQMLNKNILCSDEPTAVPPSSQKGRLLQRQCALNSFLGGMIGGFLERPSFVLL